MKKSKCGRQAKKNERPGVGFFGK